MIKDEKNTEINPRVDDDSTRKVLHVSELTNEEINAIATADYVDVDPELEKLFDS